MNRIRVATDAEFTRARKAAFLDANGDCVKCGGEAHEAHHVYGPLDNDPAHLRPLCFRCHGVAPAGEAYWEWERSGKSGPEQLKEWARPRVRAAVGSEMLDEEFDAAFEAMFSLCSTFMRRMVA